MPRPWPETVGETRGCAPTWNPSSSRKEAKMAANSHSFMTAVHRRARSGAGGARPGSEPYALGQALFQRQHLTGCFGGDETDKPSAVVDHCDGGRRTLLQEAERLFQLTTLADGRHACCHGVNDAGLRSKLLERAHEIVASEHADRLARRVDHGDIGLAGAQQRL